MKLITANFRLHLDQTVTSLATLWRIIRTDGEVLYFTDHDVDITYDSNVYSGRTGYNRSAISNSADLTVDELDIEGVFDSLEITKEDLRSGVYDYAEVYVSMVNWQDPDGDGILKLRRGWFGEIEVTQQGTYRTELRGMAQSLSQNILNYYQSDCRTDLGSLKCKIPIDAPLVGRNEVLALTEDGAVTYRRAVTTGPSPFGDITNITNSDFETGDLTGWSQVSSVWGVNASAHSGSWSADPLSSGPGSLEQTVDLRVSNGGDIPDASLASGLVEVSISAWINGWDGSGWGGGLSAVFLDSSDSEISSVGDTGETNDGTWTLYTIGAVAPANAAKIKISLDCEVVEASLWDDVTASFFDGTVVTPQTGYENRIYKVIIAGTTAATEPTYDTIVGNTTVDGTATLEAVEAWTREAEVASVTDNKNFTLTVTEARGVNDWFRYGAVRWETGNNAGRVAEIKSWTQTGSMLELFLAQPFTVQIGDKMSVYPGCNKAWNPGDCVDKFDNGKNFRGFPFIPTEDQALTYPDSRTGGAGGGATSGTSSGSSGRATEFTRDEY